LLLSSFFSSSAPLLKNITAFNYYPSNALSTDPVLPIAVVVEAKAQNNPLGTACNNLLSSVRLFAIEKNTHADTRIMRLEWLSAR
jgi:hypothetical protein